MSTVEVTQSHALSVDAAKIALESFAEDIKKFGMNLTWSGARAELKGTGASGSVEVTSSKVTVVIKLGMMAKVAGVDPERLRASVARRLESALSPKLNPA